MSLRQFQAGGPQLPVTQLYRKLDVVGKGAYGAVYKGVHIPTNTVVALKIIDLDTADDDTADIQREVALLSQLRAENNNITKYHGCWLDGPRVWIVMDFASGGSVRTLMKGMKNGILDERWIVVITREVLVALAYLHKSNIIHRDIKTANILIQSTGKVMLCDFGVSALLATSHSKRTTFIGTPHYMAPEVLTSSSYDSKADIWSLGITLYEMATGSQPLSEIPQLQAINIIPKIKPPRLPEQHGSKDMKDFVSNCLRELPNDRLSADDLAKTKWIKNSSRMPVSSLEDLLIRYEQWSQAGGIRTSLAQPAPWELGAEIVNSEDPTVNTPWEFDTVRAPQIFANVSEDGALESLSPLSSQPSSHVPESLRMLFDEGSSKNASDAFGDFGLERSFDSQFSRNLSSSSLPDLSKILDSDVEGPPEPVSSSHHFIKALQSTDDEQLAQSFVQPLRLNRRHRDPRNGHASGDILTARTETDRVTESPGPSKPLPTTPDGTGDGTARPLRRRAAPNNFQFPRPVVKDLPLQTNSPVDQLTPPDFIPSHQTAASEEYTRSNPLSAYNVHSSNTQAADIVRRPSVNRQASVAVMENVSAMSSHAVSTERIRNARLQPLLTAGRAEADVGNMPKAGIGLRDFLKLSPLPPDVLGADMLPPSPSVASPNIRVFNSTPSNLASNQVRTAATTAVSQSVSSTSSPRTNEFANTNGATSHMRSSSSVSQSMGLTGVQSLRHLDIQSLWLTREDTHHELARTVEELAQWLKVVESGLASALATASEEILDASLESAESSGADSPSQTSSQRSTASGTIFAT